MSESTSSSAFIGNVRYAGFLRRWAALFLDSLILGSVWLFLIPITTAVAVAILPLKSDHESWFWMLAMFGPIGFCFLATLGYFAGMESSRLQATIGKMAFAIKVTDREGNRQSFARALARRLATLLSSLTLGIGFVMAGFTQHRQALHDLFTGTLVVNKWAYSAFPERQQQGLPGWLVAVFVLAMAIAALAALGILAAVAIPAYHDYTQRARVSAALTRVAPLRMQVQEETLGLGTCPDNTSPGFLAAEAYASKEIARVDIGPSEQGRCGMTIWMTDPISNHWISLHYAPEAATWICTSTLPKGQLPSLCR